MIEKLSQKDIRTLIFGAVCAAGILMFWVGSKVYDLRKEARASLTDVKDKLELIDVDVDEVDKAKRAGLMSIVPVFDMPKEEETQRVLFINKLTEQFKTAGIKNEPLQFYSIGKSGQAGYRLLRLKCSAKCRLTQVLDLLYNLKKNPYLVGVEELRMRIDKKKPQEVDLDLTVSTFIK